MHILEQSRNKLQLVRTAERADESRQSRDSRRTATHPHSAELSRQAAASATRGSSKRLTLSAFRRFAAPRGGRVALSWSAVRHDERARSMQRAARPDTRTAARRGAARRPRAPQRSAQRRPDRGHDSRVRTWRGPARRAPRPGRQHTREAATYIHVPRHAGRALISQKVRPWNTGWSGSAYEYTAQPSDHHLSAQSQTHRSQPVLVHLCLQVI
jgi:hypothetical protein